MTPIQIQAGPVERVQLEVPTRNTQPVQGNAVERVQLVTPTTITVTIGG